MEMKMYLRMWKVLALKVALSKKDEYCIINKFYTDGCTTYAYKDKDEDIVISFNKNKLYDMLLADGFTIEENFITPNDLLVKFKISRENIVKKAKTKKKGL